MTLHELRKVISHNAWRVAMSDIPDVYAFLDKMGAKLPQEYSWIQADAAIENYPALSKSGEFMIIAIDSETWNLLYNLQVLEIKEDFTVVVGYNRFHS